MPLDESDFSVVVDSVLRFVRNEQKTVFARSEYVLSDAELSRYWQRLCGLGLLQADAPLLLWQGCDDPLLRQQSRYLLSLLAQQNAGTAALLHVQALTTRCIAQAGLALDTSVCVVDRFWWQGREPLLRWLCAQPLSADDTYWLEQIGHHDRLRFVQGLPEWKTLLTFAFDADKNNFSVDRYSSASLSWYEHRQFALGLNELPLYEVQLGVPEQRYPLEANALRCLLLSLLIMDGMGLLAIAGGALKKAEDIASGYAQTRRQGGKLLMELPAVRLMLGEIAATQHILKLSLQACDQQQDIAALYGVLSCTSMLFPKLVDAASLCVQIMGGIGYMQDVGVEKILRDVSALALMAGSVRNSQMQLADIYRG